MKIKIKEIYLILLIVLGLTGTAIYTTYALFTSTSEINNVIGLDTNTINNNNNNIYEYEMVKVPAGKEVLIELNAINNTSNTLYYKAWYQMVNPNTKTEDIDIGLYTEKNNTSASGTITTSTKKTLLVGINNISNSEIIINLGILVDKGKYPSLTNGKIQLPANYPSFIMVTPEYLQNHSTITETPVNITHNNPGAAQTNVLKPGTYKLEAWGAQGGNYSSGHGGKGGYSYGTLTINNEITIYSNVGGAGANSSGYQTVAGGYNGGTGSNGYGGGGGGASDIRIGQNNLYARVIVAGGGGGSGYGNANPGGFGGGTTGGAGTKGTYAGGGGGTQTSGGTSAVSGGQGKFGSGGVTNTTGGGAGGGWYGGGHGRNGGTDSAGGGGSGYVYTSSTASSYPSGCLLNSKYYLTNATTTGNNRAGNGMIKITGTSKTVSTTIPLLEGLDDIMITPGTNYNLTGDVKLTCENGTTGCKILKTSITNTTTLSLGSYKVKYFVESSNHTKYIYTRNLYIISESTKTLKKLGLESSLKTDTPDFSKTSCSSGCEENTVGIYKAKDDLGDSYYFRGDVTNNYVKFGKYEEDAYEIWNIGKKISTYSNSSACPSGNICTKIASAGSDMYWRIVRINGDGTIRLIYDGTSAHPNGEVSTDKRIGEISFNINGPIYVGYMYDNYTKSSTIKVEVDNWYKTYILDKGYSSSVADAIYCNDMSLDPHNNNTERDIQYGAYDRIGEKHGKGAILTCPQDKDKYTVINGTIPGGNGKLTYPAGLITADEMIMAGYSKSLSKNTKLYLYTGSHQWSASPSFFRHDAAIVFNAHSSVSEGGADNSQSDARVVVSLKSTAIKSGSGTASDPFVV